VLKWAGGHYVLCSSAAILLKNSSADAARAAMGKWEQLTKQQ